MRCASALLLPIGFAFLAACEQPTAPVATKAQFDALPGQEITQITGPIQAFGNYDQFINATGATLRINPNHISGPYDYGWYWGNPYQENGMRVDYYPLVRPGSSWGVAMWDKTSLLPGQEFTFNGPDDFTITSTDYIYALGIYVVDNTTTNLSGTGYPGVDTRWIVQLFNAAGDQIASLHVDPPRNRAYFLGVSSPVPFTSARFTEQNPDALGENDYWGNIYATPQDQPPVITLVTPPAMIGEAFVGTAEFADADSHLWSVSISYGEGGAVVNLETTSHAVPLEHTYASVGEYTLAISVTDDRGVTSSKTAVVQVLSPAQATTQLEQAIDQVVAGGAIAPQDAKPLQESLSSALKALDSGNKTAALGKLGAFDNKLNALANSHRIDAATLKQLLDYSARVQQSIKR